MQASTQNEIMLFIDSDGMMKKYQIRYKYIVPMTLSSGVAYARHAVIKQICLNEYGTS